MNDNSTPRPTQVPPELWDTWTEEARERLQARTWPRTRYFSDDEFWDAIVAVSKATGRAPAPSHVDVVRDVHGGSVTSLSSQMGRYWLCVQMKGAGQADDYQLPLVPANGAIRRFWWSDFTSQVRSSVLAVLIAREMVYGAKKRARGSGVFAFLRSAKSPEVARLEEGLEALKSDLRSVTRDMVDMMVGSC